MAMRVHNRPPVLICQISLLKTDEWSQQSSHTCVNWRSGGYACPQQTTVLIVESGMSLKVR